MRVIIILFFINIFTITASAQTQPYHVFEYDAPVAYFTQDNLTIPNRLFNDGIVVGDLVINKCTVHEKYISGIRFIFKDKKNDATEMALFALKCDARTGAMYASWVRRVRTPSGEFKDVADVEKLLDARMETRVPVSVQLYYNTVTFKVGQKSFNQKLNFEVKEIELIGIGSNGVARFFEEYFIN